MANEKTEKFTTVTRVYPETSAAQPINLELLSDAAEALRAEKRGVILLGGGRAVPTEDFCDQLQLLITEVCNQELLQKTENIRIEMQQDSEVMMGEADQ